MELSIGLHALESPLFRMDSVNAIFLLAFILAGSLSFFYTLSTGPGSRKVLLSSLFVLASLGCILSANMLLLLLFWEMMLVTSYLMIVAAGTGSSSGAGYRYLILHVLAGAAMFLGVLVQYSVTGILSFSPPIAAAIPFFVLGIGIKVGAIPFHTWVPDAYSRCSIATSVVLSGFTTKVGVYALIRLLPGIAWIPYIGATMAVGGVIMALLQRCSRRILGYHIVSQVGYMVVGVGLATSAGIDAGTLHVINHIAYKTLLFMAAGAVIYSTGSGHLPRLGGLARSMPVTFLCALAGALAISGVPPFNGFVSKYWLKTALEAHPVLLQSLTVAGIGTGASFAKLLWYTYLRPAGHRNVPLEPVEARPAMLVPMVALAAFCLYTGINPGILAPYLPGGGIPPDPFTVSGLVAGSWPPLLGVALFAAAGGVLSRAPVPRDMDYLYGKLVDGLNWVGTKATEYTEDRLQGNLVMALIVLLLALVAFR